MTQLRRIVLLATIVVLPLVVWQSTRFGFELPKSHVAVVASMALLVLCLPRLPLLWRQLSFLGRVMIVASGVLAATVVVSLWLSDARGMSLFAPEARFLGAVVVVGAVGLVVVVPAVVLQWREIEQVLWVLAGVLLVAGVIVVAQQVGWNLTPWPSGPQGGVLGTLGNANFVGMFASLGAPLVLFLWFSRRETRAAAVVLALLTVASIRFAGSELGAFAAAAGALVAGVALLPRRVPRVQGWLLAAAPLGGVLAGLAAVVVGNLAEQRSAITRWSLWQSTLRMITDNPLDGVGWARLRAHYLAYRLPETVTLVPGGTEQRADSSHAWVIDLAANSGLVALLAMLVLLVVAGLLLRRAWHAANDAHRPAIAGLTGLLAAHGVGSSLAVPSIVGVWVGFLLLGLALATATVEDHRPRSKRGRHRFSKSDTAEVIAGVGALVVVGLLLVPLHGFHRGAVEASRAVAVFETEQLDAAAAYAERSVDYSTWWSEPWMVLARIEDERNDPEAVLQALTGALDADPRHFDAALSLALTSVAIDDQEQAEIWFDRVAELDPYGFRANSRRAGWALSVGRPDIAREALDTIELGIEPGGAGWSTYLRVLEAYEQVTD